MKIMKSLIILAHPSSKSFSKAMANAYKKEMLEKWNEAEIINLYHKRYRQEYLCFENIRDVEADKVQKLIQKKLWEADEYVFIFPLWWWWVPAILKNFFDNNFCAWFAFKYQKWWKVCQLLKWKKAKIYCTCDAPRFVYEVPILWVQLRRYLWSAVLGFCGIKLVDFHLFGRMRKKTDEERKQILESIGK